MTFFAQRFRSDGHDDPATPVDMREPVQMRNRYVVKFERHETYQEQMARGKGLGCDIPWMDEGQGAGKDAMCGAISSGEAVSIPRMLSQSLRSVDLLVFPDSLFPSRYASINS